MAKNQELVEEGAAVLLQDITKGYKFRPFIQVVLVLIVIAAVAFLLQFVHILEFKNEGDLTITTLAFCWALAFLFPIILQTRSHRANQIAMGLYFAAIISLTGTIILLIVAQSTYVQARSIALLIAFLTGIGSMLFEHLHPDSIGRTTKVYLGIFGVSVAFFLCVWFYMEYVTVGYGIWIAIILTALFAYALLPEKPK